MHISIQDFGQHSAEFVDVINDDLSRRFVLRPFHDSHVRDVADGGGQLFCLANSVYDGERRTHATQLAVFEGTTGEEIRRTILPFQAYTVTYLPKSNLLAVQFMDRDICFLKAETLEIVWQTEPLFAPKLKKKWWFGWRGFAKDYREIPPDTRPYPPGCTYVSGRLFEDIDGRIWGLASSNVGDRKTNEICGASAGAFSFDVAQHQHSFHLIEFSTWVTPGLMAPSPDGRIAVRRSPQWELGPLFDAGHDSSKCVWMIEHQNLDLWSLSDQKPVIRLRVSDTPVSKFIGQQGAKTEHYLRRLAAWSSKAKDRFRMPLRKPPGTKGLNIGAETLRDLHELRNNQHFGVHWEEDSQTFWIATRYSLRRLSTDGRRGPLLVLDRFLNDEHRAILGRRPSGTDLGVGEAYPAVEMPLIKTLRTTETDVEIRFFENIIRIPKGLAISDAAMVLLTDDMITVSRIPKLSTKDVAHQIPGLFRIKSWEQADIADGLKKLAETLRHDIFSLKARGISLVFAVGCDFLDEKQFVSQLSESGPDAVSGVKEVINAWCDAVRQHDLVFYSNEDGAGPLVYLLEYLAERDDNCSEQLRSYCLLRNGEYESYARDVVLKNYLDRLGYVRPDLWQLAILYVLLFGRDGRFVVEDGKQVSDWLHTELLDAARSRLPPQDFALWVRQELASFQTQSDVFAAFGTHVEAAADARQDLQNQLKDSHWDIEFGAALTASTTS